MVFIFIKLCIIYIFFQLRYIYLILWLVEMLKMYPTWIFFFHFPKPSWVILSFTQIFIWFCFWCSWMILKWFIMLPKIGMVNIYRKYSLFIKLLILFTKLLVIPTDMHSKRIVVSQWDFTTLGIINVLQMQIRVV